MFATRACTYGFYFESYLLNTHENENNDDNGCIYDLLSGSYEGTYVCMYVWKKGGSYFLKNILNILA